MMYFPPFSKCLFNKFFFLLAFKFDYSPEILRRKLPETMNGGEYMGDGSVDQPSA